MPKMHIQTHHKPRQHQNNPATNNQRNQNSIYQVQNSEEIKNCDINLKGGAILNNTLTEYFCDGGALQTLISHET